MIHVAVEQARPGDILVVAPTCLRRRLFRRAARGTSLPRAACAGWSSTPACATCATLTEMGFPVWSKAVSRAGNGQGDARLGQCARSCAPARS